MSQEVVAVAKITAKEGRFEALRGQLTAMLEESRRSEAGMLSWSLSVPGAVADTLLVVELFVDRAAYDHHESRPEILEAAKGMGENIAGVESFTGPVSARG